MDNINRIPKNQAALLRSSHFSVLMVMPGEVTDRNSMVFAKREIDFLRGLGIKCFEFYLPTRMRISGVMKGYLSLRRAIHSLNPTVIHSHYGTMTAFITVCSTVRPVVVTFRGSDLNPVPSVNPIRVMCGHLLSQLSALRAAKIICVSRGLAGRLFWVKDKVHVIPTGVLTEVFKPIDRLFARARLGWKTDVPYVLFNAGQDPLVKRLDLAEKAVGEARKSCREIKFFVLNGNIPPEDIPLYHNAADVLLVTSDFEGSPTIVQEAIACGLPVVSVDVGDVPERLCGVSPSRIVARNPVALGSALLEILALKQRSNGPEVAAGELSYKVLTPNVVQVLSEAAQRPSKGFFG